MCKFKAGDRVVITNSEEDNPSILKNGVTGIVLDNHSYPFVQFDVIEDDSLSDAMGLGVSGRCYSVCENEIDLFHPYIQSNCYKLQQAIKKTGFQAEKLSLASNHAKTYFTGFTAESRFNSRGDITEERLNSLLTTLAFAERELLGVGAKTVDESNISSVEEKTTMVVDGVEIEGAISDFNISFDDNSKNIFDSTEMYNKYFDEASKRNQSKRDAKVKNFLIAFLVVVVILAIYFFTR